MLKCVWARQDGVEFLERNAKQKHVLPASTAQFALLIVQLVDEAVDLRLLGPRSLEAFHGLLEALLLELLLELEDSVLQLSEALLQIFVALAKHHRLHLFFRELLLRCARFGFSLAGLLGRHAEGRLDHSKSTPQLLDLGAFSDGLRSDIFEAPLGPTIGPSHASCVVVDALALALRGLGGLQKRSVEKFE